MQYKSGLNKIAMPQPWQAIAQRFCSIKICREATESVKLGFHKVKIMASGSFDIDTMEESETFEI